MQFNHVSQQGNVDHVGRVGIAGRVGHIKHVWHIGRVGHVNHVADVGNVGHVKHVDDIGLIGIEGNEKHVGFHRPWHRCMRNINLFNLSLLKLLK